MSDEKKRSPIIALIILLFIIYFFASARPLEKEIYFSPVWTKEIIADGIQKPKPANAIAHSFKIGSRYGYFLDDGTIVYAVSTQDDVTISNTAYIPFSKKNDVISIYAPDGKLISKFPQTGYPYLSGDRLFVVSQDRTSFAEYDKTGTKLYSRDFSSLITSFYANKTQSITGLLEGKVEVIKESGEKQDGFSPGGSELDVIYGVALSQDSKYAAVISGVDPQRLIVFEKKNGVYQVSYHKNLTSDFRRAVPISFSSDDKYIFFEQEKEIGIFDRHSKTVSLLQLSGNIIKVDIEEHENLYMVLCQDEKGASIIAIRPLNTLLFRTSCPGNQVFLEQINEKVFLGMDDKLVRMDILED